MADHTTNVGKKKLFLVRDGFIQTVTATNTYKLKKAVELDFDVAPPFELRYDDDLDFDVTPTGDVGTWSTIFPLTSDMVSDDEDIDDDPAEADQQTLSYWLIQLAKKKFPEIQFREKLFDQQDTRKEATFDFKGILTRINKTKRPEDGVYLITLEGIIKEYTSFELADESSS